MSRFSISRTFPVTMLAVIAAPAAAQVADPQDSSTILVVGAKEKTGLAVPNETGSRLNLTPLETPASITTIDGDTIRARGDLSVVEAQIRSPSTPACSSTRRGSPRATARAPMNSRSSPRTG